MDTTSDIEIDKVVEHCMKLFESLPKTGKPNDCEWTVLSCIVECNSRTSKHQVVSMGTGSKCIGSSKMSPNGNILNDSHAEVFARRGLLLYLYDNVLKCQLNKESIFLYKDKKFQLKDEFQYIFYSSQLPCGDACIIPKTDEECFGDILPPQKRKHETDEFDNIKRIKINCVNDIHRTGAKCLPHIKQDPKLTGKNYHILGQVRTKPGRGDRTLSVSCSDKIAKWIHVGIQGSLLDLLLIKPIFIKSFIFGAGVPYSEDSINRAFLKRDSKEAMPNPTPKLEFYQSSIKFTYLKNEVRTKPAPGSIVWINTEPKLIEVVVQGKKLGVTKKKIDCVNSYPSICKYNMFKKFLEVLNTNEYLRTVLCSNEQLRNIKYNNMKCKSKRYKEKWVYVKENFFKTWTEKPDMWNFCINDI